jgi:3-hydroxyisobutyrate dehydrogenase
MRIGCIGLGHLGTAIANRLIDCGHELTVWNRTAAKASALQATVAPTPAAVAEAVEQVHLCLFDSTAVREVLTGDHGLLTTDLRGKLLVDHTTNHFGAVLALHDLCARAGATYLEAPVLGSVVPAAHGSLTVLVSGSKAGFDRAEPVLRQLGTHLFHLEVPGLATRMKLVNNLVLAGLMAQIAEATAFAEAAGMDRTTALDILAAGAGQSMVLNAKRAKLESGDFSPHFTNSLIYKDLHCLQDLAYHERRPLYTGAMTRELFARAVAEGMEALDFSSVYRLFSRR